MVRFMFEYSIIIIIIIIIVVIVIMIIMISSSCPVDPSASINLHRRLLSFLSYCCVLLSGIARPV
jgi:ABC-type transport system involved in multi-copper enzyme maturation permease subunit